MILDRDSILSADDMPRELVSVPEWGGDVYVRSMSGFERDAFEASLTVDKTSDKAVNMRNIRARLGALCMVGEDGQRLFSDKDVDALGRKSARALDRVFDVAQRLNGLRNEDVEEMAGNSDAEPGDGSISD